MEQPKPSFTASLVARQEGPLLPHYAVCPLCGVAAIVDSGEKNCAHYVGPEYFGDRVMRIRFRSLT